MSAPRVVTQMLAEADLSAADDLAAFLTALHALGDGPPPAPAPELAERLGVSPLARPRRWLRRRVVGGATALALAVVGGTGVAAAANELPPGVQRLMARFSAHFLPFDFPPPVESGPVPAHVGTRPADRAGGREAGSHGEPSGTDRTAMAAERSHHPGIASGGVPATDDGHAGSGGGTRSAADDGVASDVADGSGSDGGSGGDGSRDGDDSPERTGGDTQQASEPDSSGSDSTGESSDGSGSTDGGTDGSGSDYVAGSSDPDGSSDSGESSSGGG